MNHQDFLFGRKRVTWAMRKALQGRKRRRKEDRKVVKKEKPEEKRLYGGKRGDERKDES
jgi:hypothetical protein